jgi:hypothetical protein
MTLSADFKLLPDDDSVLNALSDAALEILRERDKTERKIKELLEQNHDQEALRLMRKHLGVAPRLRIAK